MRTHGWAGEIPESDRAAVDRIVEAASSLIASDGPRLTLSGVARTLGVTRQTVYRYFSDSNDLVVACARHQANNLSDEVTSRISGLSSPGEVLVEGMSFVVEEIPRRAFGRLLLNERTRDSAAAAFVSAAAVERTQLVLARSDVDWTRYDVGSAAELRVLAEFVNRIVQSLLFFPGEAPRSGLPLREHVQRWVAIDFAGQPTRLATPD